MRRHGWSGNTPASDEEAVDRILDAVDSLAAEPGSTIRVTDVARSLGVSRPTVYRYFQGPEELLAASRMRSADGLFGRLASHVRGLNDPTVALVEGVAFAVESLSGDRQMAQLLGARANGSSAVLFTSELASAFSRSMLRRYDVDWALHGYDDAALDEVGELCTRTFYSLFIDPGTHTTDGLTLRRFITGWLGPAIQYRHLARAIQAVESVAASHHPFGRADSA